MGLCGHFKLQTLFKFTDDPLHQKVLKGSVTWHKDFNVTVGTSAALSKNAARPLGLHRDSWRYPCLSPLSVLAFRLHRRGPGASIFQAAVRCLRLDGLPETQHCSLWFLPPYSPSPPGCMPGPIFPSHILHSCCHSALSQSQFIPSSWPYRDMHSPGRRGLQVTL